MFVTDIRHRSVFILLLAGIACLQSCKKEDSPDPYGMQDFERLWQVTDQYYPFFDFKGIDWDAIYDLYSPDFTEITKKQKIKHLGDLLNELKDGHANLMDADGVYLSRYPYPRGVKDQDAFSYPLVTDYFPAGLQEIGDLFRYGILPGNTGYVNITSFPQVADEYHQFATVLDHLKETNGLIIDIRHNGGGSMNAAHYFICRLISEELEGTIWTRRDGSYQPVIVHEPEEPWQYTKPTALLINGKSFSSAEGMANLCKKIGHITLIGDTTGGGGGVPDEIFELPGGLTFRVPTRYGLRWDGEQVEWNGIPPDIRVPQTKEDIGDGHDKQLEAAMTFLEGR